MSAGPPLRLPPVPHLPGLTPRPPDTVFAALKASLPDRLPPGEARHSPAFAAGFHCFERGYFWEAHECWEAVWIRLPPAARERRVMRALIQLANARLKQRMDKPAARTRILARARADWAEGFARDAGPVLGLMADDWARLSG